MVNTFQSRLSAKVNKISQKLIDNSIRISGLATDVILIRPTLNKMGDTLSYNVKDIAVINMIFPAMKDIPLKRFYPTGGGVADTSANDASEIKPFECYVEVKYKVEQGSIILKFFDNVQAQNDSDNIIKPTDPWILPLRLADILGTFGARSMVWQKVNLTYLDNTLPTEVYDWCTEMAHRREVLQW